jgi:uncharacterized protein YgiM (DUF1202 family)
MLRLLTLLCAAMFLTLLIGGRDNGQLRLGLMDQTAEPAVVATETETPPAKAPDAAEVAAILASFTPAPVSQAPVTASAEPQPEPDLTALNADIQPEEEPLPEISLTEAFEGFSPSVELIAGQPDPFLNQAGDQTILYVRTRAANVRLGPSTGYAVVGRVVENEAVSVVEPARDGWVRIKLEGDGFEGYIAASLLTDIEPASGF